MNEKNIKEIQDLKKNKKKIVLCHGVFDFLHIGHITYFEQAKKYGDILVVSVTDDRYVNKGPLRPIFKINDRLNFLKKIKIVDYVLKSEYETAELIIEKIKPNVYCKGPDYKNHKNDISGQIKKEVDAIKKIGGRIVYTDDITFSSSQLINNHYSLQTNSKKQLIKRRWPKKKNMSGKNFD